MSALSSALDNFKQGLFYRGREGHLSFIGHRLGGLGILLFLGIHILDTSFAYFWPAGYGHALEIYRNPFFMVGEIILTAAVIFHGVNGLNIIFKDAFPHLWSKKSEPDSFWRVMVITALLWLPAAYLMGRSLVLSVTGQPLPEMAQADIIARTNFALVAVPVLFAVIVGVLALGASLTRPVVKRTVKTPARTLETYGWMFMRWSGALLIPLVWGHVLIQDVLIGVHTITLNYVQLRWGQLLWQVYDIALLAFAFGHGMNGVRGVVEDYIHHPGWLKAIKFLIFWGWVLITVIGAWAILGIAGK
jgi:succinate dehydrogenase cytochrome b556 subunit